MRPRRTKGNAGISSETVSSEELESATHELDPRTYRQEFQGSFENFTAGIVYYAFERDGNVGLVRYDARLPPFWSLDFNINPMCSVIGQRTGNEVRILAELVLPDSNTWAACEEFLARTAAWTSRGTIPVRIYGDATGDGRKSSASRTDWQIVREFLGRYRATLEFRVPI